MKKQVAVIGLGQFGVSLAVALQDSGHEVLALDRDERVTQDLASQITHVVQANATNESVLTELGIGNFDVAVVAIGTSIENSVLCTILLKKLGVGYVIARAVNDLHGSILSKIGADRVVYLEHEMGSRVAHEVTLGDISDYMAVIQGYGMAKLEPPYYFVGESLSALGFGHKGKWPVAVLLIQRDKEVIVTPALGEVIKPRDILIISGNDDDLDRFLTEIRREKTGNKE